MSLANQSDHYLSQEDYLANELKSDIKHELIQGQAYAMAGASKNHERIAVNIIRVLANQLQEKKLPCDIFSSDMKIKAQSDFFYPDLSITCEPDDKESEFFINTPVIIAEVLSQSTRKKDKGLKKLAYFNIPTLKEYVLIEQDYCEIEVFRQSDSWASSFYSLGDTIQFESIDVTLSVEDSYYRVENEDMSLFINSHSQ